MVISHRSAEVGRRVGTPARDRAREGQVPGVLKVIIESAALTTTRSWRPARPPSEPVPTLLKTSTGFHPAGAALRPCRRAHGEDGRRPARRQGLRWHPRLCRRRRHDRCRRHPTRALRHAAVLDDASSPATGSPIAVDRARPSWRHSVVLAASRPRQEAAAAPRSRWRRRTARSSTTRFGRPRSWRRWRRSGDRCPPAGSRPARASVVKLALHGVERGGDGLVLGEIGADEGDHLLQDHLLRVGEHDVRVVDERGVGGEERGRPGFCRR